jgi:hypothetical protein
MARFDHTPPREGKDLPMRSPLVLAVTLSLFVSLAGARAGSLAIYEDSHASPGVTALYAPGSGLVADLHYDASTAEGGHLEYPPTEILIQPTGDAVLVAFTCQLAGCEPDDWTFVAGGAGTGYLLGGDYSQSAKFGDIDLGDLTWDSASLGTLYLSSCVYSDASAVERDCTPFTVAQTPEPATGALVGLTLAAFGVARRRRS